MVLRWPCITIAIPDQSKLYYYFTTSNYWKRYSGFKGALLKRVSLTSFTAEDDVSTNVQSERLGVKDL